MPAQRLIGVTFPDRASPRAPSPNGFEDAPDRYRPRGIPRERRTPHRERPSVRGRRFEDALRGKNDAAESGILSTPTVRSIWSGTVSFG